MSRQNLIVNAFRPSEPIDEPNLFAGRSSQLEMIAQALHTDGACPVVYGDPGLGKTSLALQTWHIALGSRSLLRQHHLEQWVIRPDESFLAIYVPCTDGTSTKDLVLTRIAESLGGLTREESRPTLVDHTTRRQVSLKVFEHEVIRSYHRSVKNVLSLDLPPEDLTYRLGQQLHELTGSRVLVIIDEFDRVRDTSGFASYLKSFSTCFLRFMLVGAAQNVSDLFEDHQSLERMAVPVSVPRMKRHELLQIIDQTMEQLGQDHVPMRFTDEARDHLANVAGGFPWFVHVLGQQALLLADHDRRSNVTYDDIEDSIHALIRSRFAQQFRDVYQRAVRDSPNRELVLRAFAQQEERNVPTSDTYRVLKEQLGVQNPSTYKSQLVSDAYGRVFLSLRYGHPTSVQFSNEMFKVYVRLRSSIFEGVDRKVKDAFGYRHRAIR